ncbi:hypothetical protein E8E14_006415 [Neopestalotiopsis sp. 37M]|nr:hypothetical protein E8E14_006415 [Neopestalotiopsis sp. 37M]
MLVPWIKQRKSLFQQFMDFVTDATCLRHDTKAQDVACANGSGHGVDDTLDRHLWSVLDLIKSMKQWLLLSDIKMPLDPHKLTLDTMVVSDATQTRTRQSGYSRKASYCVNTNFNDLQMARLLHIYWTLLLELYMDILGSTLMCSRLLSVETPDGAMGSTGMGTTALPTKAAMRAECRRLADDISLFGEFCSQNVWQSFGTLMGTWSLEAAMRWYLEYDQPQMGISDESRALHIARCSSLLKVLRFQNHSGKPSLASSSNT